MSVVSEVERIAVPIIENLGAELVDIQYTHSVLRLSIDMEGGVSTNVLARASRMISRTLDEDDPIPGKYTLEVSSPGVERPLRSAEHWEKAVGETVSIKLTPGSDVRRLIGELLSVSASEVDLSVTSVDGTDLPEAESRTVALADINKARTVYDWSRAFAKADAQQSDPAEPREEAAS
ncbi:MAG: ribosome maturation factor RimP [Actinomycetia bacterium]|nr:ribosome maturation factor RimP [Actinomycetes bacterium]MCP3909364.1 ribosome maturation factor RimP [Actinomycetes bacterium]MCP4087623.1 ribosome maturation factor RimP [Actinomycetes bacterium]